MEVLWILMVLMPISCLPEATRGPPIENLRMDPESSRLTWDLRPPAADIYCVKEPDQTQGAEEDTYCPYETLSLCTVTKYTVHVGQPPYSASIIFPERDENPETAPVDLACWVHDVDFMSCTWAVGRAAPGDVQYRLYWKDASRYRECGHYRTDSGGRHVGCRFSDISKYPRDFVVMVNGTSALSRISCRDCFADLQEIERLSPPNVTARCNKTSSFMAWKMFSHFNRNFKYELQVNKSTGSSFTETVSTTGFLLPNPGNYVARVRVRDGRSAFSSWSPWSPAQSFQCDPDEEQPSLVLWTSLLAAGTLVVALLGLLLCTRYSVMRRLFPPVPRVRPPACDHVPNGELLVLRAGSEDCPVAEVQLLQEQ